MRQWSKRSLFGAQFGEEFGEGQEFGLAESLANLSIRRELNGLYWPSRFWIPGRGQNGTTSPPYICIPARDASIESYKQTRYGCLWVLI